MFQKLHLVGLDQLVDLLKLREKSPSRKEEVNTERSDIDLSLKQVSTDQKKKKLLEVKRYEKGRTLLDSVKTKAKLSDADVDKLEEETLYSKFDSVYDAFFQKLLEMEFL